MWSRLLLAFSVATSIRAQQDPADVLLRARAKIVASLDRLPRYMCTETVDRSSYLPDFDVNGTACDDRRAPPGTHLVASDRLRMDVAQASDREMYSWVGESRFDDRAITDIVRDGAISNGSFTGYLSVIFRTDAAGFTYKGETTKNGRALLEFGFDIPREKSHYSFSDGHQSLITGYGGTLLVDPQSADLVQISVRTNRLPPETSACYTSTTLDYTVVNPSGAGFLLPSASLFHILNTDGSASENRTALSNCHEFLGESTLSFASPADAATQRGADNKPVSQALMIPPGLTFRVALTQPVDTATAATGDPVKARLVTPIRTDSKVLVPSGAAIRARIVRFRQFHGAAPSVTLELRLETVETGGVSLPLAAEPAKNPLPQSKNGSLQQRVNLGALQGVQNRPLELVFKTGRRPYVIRGGLEMEWVTATQTDHGS